ncbi:hypothetical protein LX83_001373 [Goodfellowiella coeruleoviolacea]|uniref:Uncharacterized protein n=1 Tax=Goodfellowiella coeruleoviolacea TaxID=334858 RepID=A0AAE3GE98_9PSEU|nr:hypothetical protein [Goodfellowiella coeruleoviolacea]
MAPAERWCRRNGVGGRAAVVAVVAAVAVMAAVAAVARAPGTATSPGSPPAGHDSQPTPATDHTRTTHRHSPQWTA